MKIRSIALVATMVVASLPGAAVALAQEAPTRRPDVIYVPTPEAVVEAMLQVANVGKDDIVYDLGCGDGRIPVTAAKKYGARGVGIDIDPQRIKEANENVARNNVGDRRVAADVGRGDRGSSRRGRPRTARPRRARAGRPPLHRRATLHHVDGSPLRRGVVGVGAGLTLFDLSGGSTGARLAGWTGPGAEREGHLGESVPCVGRRHLACAGLDRALVRRLRTTRGRGLLAAVQDSGSPCSR